MLPLKEYIKHPSLFFSSVLRDYGFWIPDRWYLQMKYYLEMGNWLNLKSPKTFGEKIQWLKLYDRRSEYTMMVDKYAVKDYVASVIGKEYVIPTLGVWDSPEEIDFDDLPQQFVLKPTHLGGGSVFICKNKTSFDINGVVERMKGALKGDMYKVYREWPYKNVPRRVIAEKYIKNSSDESLDLTDYKFYCFSGIPMYCQVIKDRNSKETIDFFDMDWNHQTFYGLNPVYVSSSKIVKAKRAPAKPIHFDEMKEMARKLSEGLPFSRIDLYDTKNGPLFGEITFYPASGIGTFAPSEYNIILGEMINLPNM